MVEALYENGSVQQPPVLNDRDVIEARALRREQVLAALLHGDGGRAGHPSDVARRGFVLGVALSAAIAVTVGIAGLVGAGGGRRR